MVNVLRAGVLVLGPLIGYLINGTTQSLLIGLGCSAIVVGLELVIERIPLDTIVFGGVGAFAGILFTRVMDWLVFKLDNPSYYAVLKQYFVLVNLCMAYLGAMIAIRKKNELDLLDKDLIVKGKKNTDIKVLDTSVLIDGRISDIIQTGFVGGRILVPRFVLHELQMVADSSDATKRQRGRRGLDILKRIQDESDVNIKIYDKDYPHIKEVDAKLIELAKELGAKVATNDFNLNKVAALQGVSVLNINELAGALKSVVLPGDALMIYLAKDGKEKAQAVGYLDDGTMVVVDDARKLIGKRVGVHVNSILQTSAGRMVFARLQDGKGDQSESNGVGKHSDPHASQQ